MTSLLHIVDELDRFAPPTFYVHPRDLDAYREAYGDLLFESTVHVPAASGRDLIAGRAPHRPVLHHNVLTAAAAECTPPEPPVHHTWPPHGYGFRDIPTWPFVVTERIAEASPHYTVTEDGRVWDNLAGRTVRSNAETWGPLARPSSFVEFHDEDLAPEPITSVQSLHRALTDDLERALARNVIAMLAEVPPPLTDEERAAREQERRERQERIEAESARFLADLTAIPDGLARDVLALHKPSPDEWPSCTGCDYAGYEGEPPEWPCRTVEVIAEGRRITVPGRVYIPRKDRT